MVRPRLGIWLRQPSTMTDTTDTTRWWARLRAAHQELTAIQQGLRANGVPDYTSGNWARLGLATELVEAAALSVALLPHTSRTEEERRRSGLAPAMESPGREAEAGHRLAALLDTGTRDLRAFAVAFDDALADAAIPVGRIALLEALAAGVEAVAARIREEHTERGASRTDAGTPSDRERGHER